MYGKGLALLALVTAAQAHMHLFFPPTLKGDNNPFTKGDADPLLNYPYGCCGKPSPGPCKGHLGLLDTDEGKPVVTWQAGQKANFSLSGLQINTPTENPYGGNHFGGSCQVGLSLDKGKTFKVVSTWQGNCPLREGGEDPANQVFDFVVPADVPAGNAVFAWTWVNREKEFNMNCASVAIAGGNGENQQQPAASSSAPAPSKTQSAQHPESTGAQYTLKSCTCECPSQTYTDSCQCTCESPAVSRRLVEREALTLHKRRLQHAEKMKAPVRRTEAVAFKSRPDMLINIDWKDKEDGQCHSAGSPYELKFPDPGPTVVQGDGEYQLKEPTC
ncbi:uncharacterized protein BDR25DRAFT_304220 [Lindgomyces ingoldianus]|uniref:Uncharacterized protein n=1 Tax=Lindgomyces ingoldianus TaxID=673940 RepID=A0ACB6QTC4_9PLEO|nr:uncharacterized protein BDR25DRAFT_304220 [Lindgomyces ingoldianus]KAF2469780.1 hypothetical protein BDR25DRAFT_304220 [Lindgomyces ingoldianus]